MSNESVRPVLLGMAFATFSLTSHVAVADTLTFSILKSGNATSLEKEIQKVEHFSVSSDQTKLNRSDKQFNITTSFALEDGPTGETVVVPYSGTENTKYDGQSLDYELKDLRFGAANLAVWLGRTVDQVKDLGFLQNKPMDMAIYTHCQDMLNAYFNPRDNLICIGHLMKTLGRDAVGGMASMAWDADVVVHEMGHGVFQHVSTMTQDNYFSFGNDMLGAMNEGQADFFAHTITGTVELAPWMMNLAKEYFKVKNPAVYERIKDERALRVINNEYLLDQDSFGEIHDDGRIFAGALYDLSKKIGKKPALQLWLTAVSKIQEASNFYDHAQFVLQADEELNGGKNKQVITEAFKRRGIFGNAAIKDGDVEVAAKVMDKRKEVAQMLRDLGIGEAMIYEITAALNGNGKIDKGECVSLELSFKNPLTTDLVGAELFVPKHKIPKGLVNQGQNRSYLGLVKAGKTVPEKLELANPMRPWLFMCADKDFNPATPLPVIVRTSSEGYVEIPVKI